MTAGRDSTRRVSIKSPRDSIPMTAGRDSTRRLSIKSPRDSVKTRRDSVKSPRVSVKSPRDSIPTTAGRDSTRRLSVKCPRDSIPTTAHGGMTKRRRSSGQPAPLDLRRRGQRGGHPLELGEEELDSGAIAREGQGSGSSGRRRGAPWQGRVAWPRGHRDRRGSSRGTLCGPRAPRQRSLRPPACACRSEPQGQTKLL